MPRLVFGPRKEVGLRLVDCMYIYVYIYVYICVYLCDTVRLRGSECDVRVEEREQRAPLVRCAGLEFPSVT